MQAIMIDARDAKKKVDRGEALLVCAYESDDQWKKVQLEGSIPLSNLKKRLDGLTREQELIFYCA